MRRRDFIRLAGLSPALPLLARAQQGATGGRVAKIGVLLHAGSAEEEKVYLHILTKAFNILVTSKARTLCSCIDFPPNSWSGFAALPESWSKVMPRSLLP
jgi:putative tryptophan/tyrosine transport system substrate-binding protein